MLYVYIGCEGYGYPREALSEFRTSEIASAGFSGYSKHWSSTCGSSGPNNNIYCTAFCNSFQDFTEVKVVHFTIFAANSYNQFLGSTPVCLSLLFSSIELLL